MKHFIENIKDGLAKLRGKKIEYILDGKKLNLLLYKSPDNRMIACSYSSGIAITDKFFKFTKDEQDAILYHELYHEITYGKYFFRNFIAVLFPKLVINSLYEQELNADKYAFEKKGNSIITALEKFNNFGRDDLLTHPMTEFRINNLITARGENENHQR